MDIIKKIAFSNALFYKILMKLKKIKNRGKVKITKLSHFVRIDKDIVGHNNSIFIDKNTTIHKALIRIHGNNNKIRFGKNVIIGSGCSFWMEGNNISIVIGDNTEFSRDIQINAQEDNSMIIIGSDCMFSNTITIRTSDSHPIYDLETNERLNNARNVIIGNHVWIAPNSKVMKGVKIGDGSIIGSDTMVTKSIEKNVLAVGHPAKPVKFNIKWTHDKLF